MLAPICDPRGHVRHWSETVVSTDPHSEDRIIVRYDEGHRVGHYGRIMKGSVFTLGAVPLD